MHYCYVYGGKRNLNFHGWLNYLTIKRLEMENEYLKQQNDALMEIKDISVDDIKTLIESKESINNISNLLNIMTKRTF